MKSILSRYLIIIIPILAGILSVLAFTIYSVEKKDQEQNIKKHSYQIIDARSEQITIWLQSLIFELEQVGQKEVVKSMNWETMKNSLISFAEKRSDTYSFLFVCFPDGSYYTTTKGLASSNISDRKYFTEIMSKNKDHFITNPLISRSTGEKKYNLAVPIKNTSGDVIGCLVGSVKLETLSEIAGKMKIANTGYGFIIDSKGIVTAHRNTDYLLKMNILNSDTMGFTNLKTVGQKMINGKRDIDLIVRPDNVEEMLVYTTIAFSPSWTLGIAVPTQEIFVGLDQLLIFIVLGFLFALIITSVLIWLVSKKIIISPISNIVKVLNIMKDGDLRAKMKISGKGEIKELYYSITTMTEKWKEILESVKENIDTVNIGTGQISQSADQIAQGASEQAASAEEISASIEEMVAAISQNTENSQITERTAINAEHGIIKGQEATKETINRMRDIAERITVINEISEKTDLLAINAAIEAARAGEFGKGFSVVAAEVRSLAVSSKKAANQIMELANSSLVIADKTDTLFSEIVPDVRNTAKLVREITAASIEQNTNANQISKAIQEFNSVVQQNSATAEELSTGAEELSSQSESLKETISYFTLENQSSEVIQNQMELLQSFTEFLKQNNKQKMNNYEISLKPKRSFDNQRNMNGLNIDLSDNNNADDDFDSY